MVPVPALAGQGGTAVAAAQGRHCCQPFPSWQGLHKPLAFALDLSALAEAVFLAVSLAKGGWAVSQHLRIVPAVRRRAEPFHRCFHSWAPSAVQWEMVLSLSFCPIFDSAVCWHSGSLHYSKGRGRSLASRWAPG